MKRWSAAVAAVVFASVSVHADVTIKSRITVEGGPPGASAAGPIEMVMQIKGMKSRTDMDAMGQKTIIIADMAARKVYMLNPTARTAQEIESAAPIDKAAAAAAAASVDASVKPTGQSRVINSWSCDEYTLKMSMSMADLAGAQMGQMPPEAAEMMKGLSMAMDGSIWVAKNGPGAAEFAAFTRAALAANLSAVLSGAANKSNPGLDRLMAATSQAQGLPCLTEMNMTVDGTGPIADMMKQSGAVKTSVTTTSISTDALAADLFAVPADYKIVKQ